MAQESSIETEKEKATASSDAGREYSEGTAMIQKMERGFTRAAYRMANGVAEGIRVYYDEGEKSAAKKQDDAARDMLTNATHSFGKNLLDTPSFSWHY